MFVPKTLNVNIAMMKKGADLPLTAYNIPPNGYPNRTPNAILPRIIPITCDRVFSSGYIYVI